MGISQRESRVSSCGAAIVDAWFKRFDYHTTIARSINTHEFLSLTPTVISN